MDFSSDPTVVDDDIETESSDDDDWYVALVWTEFVTFEKMLLPQCPNIAWTVEVDVDVE